MEFEDEFGIRIPDADAEQLRTVGAVVRYIARRKGLQVPPVPSLATVTRCSCVTAFHTVRRVLTQEFQVPRRAVRPNCRVMALVEKAHQGALEERLIALGAKPSILRRPDPSVLFMAFLMLGTIVIGFIAAFRFNLTSIPSATTLIAAVAGLVIVALLIRQRLVLCHTRVEDIVRQLTFDVDRERLDKDAQDIELGMSRNAASNEDAVKIQEVRERVCEIVSRQLGVERSLLSDATSFVRDLGI